MFYCTLCDEATENPEQHRRHITEEDYRVFKIQTCTVCGAKMGDPGGHDIDCPECGQRHNAFGQRLKDSAPRL